MPRAETFPFGRLELAFHRARRAGRVGPLLAGGPSLRLVRRGAVTVPGERDNPVPRLRGAPPPILCRRPRKTPWSMFSLPPFAPPGALSGPPGGCLAGGPNREIPEPRNNAMACRAGANLTGPLGFFRFPRFVGLVSWPPQGADPRKPLSGTPAFAGRGCAVALAGHEKGPRKWLPRRRSRTGQSVPPCAAGPVRRPAKTGVLRRGRFPGRPADGGRSRSVPASPRPRPGSAH